MNKEISNQQNSINTDKIVLDLIQELYEDQDLETFSKKLLIRLTSILSFQSGSISLVSNQDLIFNQIWTGSEWTKSEQFNLERFNKSKTLWQDSRVISINEKEISNQDSLSPLNNIKAENAYISTPIVNKNGEIIGIIELFNTTNKLLGINEDTENLIYELLRYVSSILDNILKSKYINKQTELLNKNSKYSRLIIENAPYIIFSLKNNKIDFFNSFTLDLLEYKKLELENLKIEEIIYENDLKTFWNNLKESDKTNTPIEITVTFLSKNDELIYSKGHFIKHGNNSYFFYLFPIKAEQTEHDEFSLSQAVKSVNSAVTITDINKKIIYINPAHTDMFGYSPNELIGIENTTLYPHEDPSGLNEKINEAISTFGWEGERIGLRKDNSAFPLYEKTSTIKNAEGNVIGIVSILDDISERKKLEQSLKESEEKYRTLIETSQTPIISVYKDGNINIFNPSAIKLFEYKKEDIPNKNIFSLLPEKSKELLLNILQDELTFSKYSENTIETEGLKKGGEEFPIEISISKCKIEGKELYTLIIFDITQRKSLEEQLIQSAKLAAVGELVSGITHEVNNPLAVVMGYSEMLMNEDDSSEEIKKIMNIIYNESERARKVVQNLLSFARRHEPEKELVDIVEILEKTTSLTEYDLKKHRVKLIEEYENNLPMILADPNQLQQVFLNLIINAEQAINGAEIEDGEIKVIARKSKKSESLEIIFEDNGPGIPQESLKKIFTPFYTTKPVGKGTGLGLSVSIEIINKHNGEISAINKKDGGTAFYILLPIEN